VEGCSFFAQKGGEGNQTKKKILIHEIESHKRKRAKEVAVIGEKREAMGGGPEPRASPPLKEGGWTGISEQNEESSPRGSPQRPIRGDRRLLDISKRGESARRVLLSYFLDAKGAAECGKNF